MALFESSTSFSVAQSRISSVTLISFAFTLISLAPSLSPAQKTCSSLFSNIKKPGHIFEMTERLGSEDFTDQLFYIGEYGGQHLAIRNKDGDQLMVLSEKTVREQNLDSGSYKFPLITKQPTFDSCLPTSIAYLQELTMPANSPYRNLSQSMRGAFMIPAAAPSFLAPFAFFRSAQVPSEVGKMQVEAAQRILKSSGINHEITTNPQELIEALRRGQKALVGFRVDQGTVTLMNEKWDEILRTGTPVPYSHGEHGHALVAVGIVEGGPFKMDYILLADPGSGQLVPMPIRPTTLNALSFAILVSPPSIP